MSGTAPNLSYKQDKAIAALLSEPSITAAASKVGVNERTLYRWLDNPAFATAYRHARRQAVAQAVARLQQYSHAAVLVLLQVMVDKGTPASTRVIAATKVLEFALRAVEVEDIEARLTALEQVHQEQQR